MPRRIRIQDPDAIYHVTNRTQERRFYFRPDDELNALVMFWLRAAVRIYRVELYAVVIMGNHFHLIVRAPLMNLGKFMCYFQTNFARAVNKLRGRVDGTVFPRRYSAEPILDLESLERMLAYVVLNPVAANLVERPGDYPGYSSWRQHVGYAQPKRCAQEPPPITPPPMWAHLTEQEISERWRQLVRGELAELNRTRRGRVRGAKAVREMDWWRRPRTRSRCVRKPRAHGRTKEQWKRFARFADRVATRHQAAMIAWRSDRSARFPYGTFPPARGCEVRGKRQWPDQFRLVRRLRPGPQLSRAAVLL